MIKEIHEILQQLIEVKRYNKEFYSNHWKGECKII